MPVNVLIVLRARAHDLHYSENALFQATNDKFYVKTVRIVEEISRLVEFGFE